jgi:hypothetical protein
LSQYYYTVASLPFLDFDSDPPMTEEEFIDICTKECSEKDFTLLQSISLTPPGSSGETNTVVDSFYTWERSLRNELVILRAKKKGVDPDAYIREGNEDLGSVQTARGALMSESPLAVEETLNKARWIYLDQLETGHYFDLEKLAVYKLKLEILENKAKTDKERGKEMYHTIMDHCDKKLEALESNDE